MAFEDLFGNNFTTSAGNMTPDPGDFTGGDPNAGGGFLDDLFSDQNFIRGLGEAGAAISSGQPFGKAAGDFASNMIRRRAFQKSARESKEERQQSKNLFEELLRDPSKYVGPKEDNATADAINFTGDTATVKFSNAPQKQGIQRQLPLEAIRKPTDETNDLPDFSNESSTGELDFAGLDPEDISILLSAEQKFGELDQKQMKMVLDEKNRRKAAITANKIRQEDLKIAAENKLAESMQKKRESVAKIEAEALKVENNKEIARVLAESKATAAEIAKIPTAMQSTTQAMQLKEANARIEKLEAETTVLTDGKKLTPAQQNAKTKQDADLANKEAELGMKLDEIEKKEYASIQPTYMDDENEEISVPFGEREANAIQANNRANNKIYYQIRPEIEDTPGLVWGTDVPGEVIPIMLPRINGKQITSQDIIDTIGTPNPKTGKAYTEAEVLNSISRLSKQGG